ncbi:hypothetical protein HU200_057540 [Digitaria exilis]|uniref:Uncharacterized protein n=1 Tax=Digitaria exilis TaxID=1010633 RepID=A0A835E1D2_9POAL|nr:hypothetical protein HU200_057540 [Digitaria exilis]CAB3498229.1 unnamed protein product [Digitaria exilis]
MAMEVESVSCECCGLEEECTGEYIAGVRGYFGGRWLCGLCSEAVKYEAGKCKGAPDVEEAVRAHMAICRTLKMSGGPAGRVADGMRQMLRTASWKKAAGASSSPRGHHRASPPLSVGL